MAKKKRLKVPDNVRITTWLFPPYGLAWLWTNEATKGVDPEIKTAAAIGAAIYLLIWLILVGFLLFFFTPLGAGF